MSPHTFRTRPRHERLAARTEVDPDVTILLLAPILAVVHPAAVAVAVLVLAARRLGPAPEGRSPTGHGRVRRRPATPGRA
jgi:hypothetical protein